MKKIYCTRFDYRPNLFAFSIGYDNSSVGISGVEGLYNGNISETHWRSGSDNALRSYGYRYDALNRLTDAFYKRESLATNGYNEHISYDPNGNITMLQRFGGLDEQNISLEIDNLGYRYGADSNKLLAVNDASGSPEGFSDGTNSGDDFAYDASGNMTSDKNKNITSIAYNHLDLPVRIVFGGNLNTRVDYVYDALGAKLQKTVVQYNPVGDHSIVLTSVTDYLGFQYKDGVLQFFPTSEGYVSHTKGSYSYVYNYTDHLGNVRMSYAKNPARPSELKVIEENHYYPFGLKHQNYNSEEFLFDKKDSNLQLRAPVGGQILPYQYKYQGQERQDELGLNWDSFKYRNYDYAIGRFMSIDPLAEKYAYQSPYNFAENRVIDGRELEGLEWVDSKNVKVYDPSIVNKDGSKGNFTSAVTTEHRNLAKSLNQTGTGKEQFQTLVNSTHPIQTVLDNASAPKDGAGKLIFGSTKNSGVMTGTNPDTGKVEDATVASSTITFFTKNIGKLDTAVNDGDKSTGGTLYGTKVPEGTNYSEIIGAIFGHEIDHTTIENTIIEANGGNYEHNPTQISNKIIKESNEEKQQ